MFLYIAYMQSGQVSVWVPIFVGIIGLTGVVLGQLISAAREDRRWQRERDREELRWQREQEKDVRSRDHEYDKYWIDRKIDIYAHLLQASAEWKEAAYSCSFSRSNSPSEEVFARVDRGFSETTSQIGIFGSTELIALVENLRIVQLDYFFFIVGLEPMSTSKRKEMTDALDKGYNAIVKQVRDELRITRPIANVPIDEMKA